MRVIPPEALLQCKSFHTPPNKSFIQNSDPHQTTQIRQLRFSNSIQVSSSRDPKSVTDKLYNMLYPSKIYKLVVGDENFIGN